MPFNRLELIWKEQQSKHKAGCGKNCIFSVVTLHSLLAAAFQNKMPYVRPRVLFLFNLSVAKLQGSSAEVSETEKLPMGFMLLEQVVVAVFKVMRHTWKERIQVWSCFGPKRVFC